MFVSFYILTYFIKVYVNKILFFVTKKYYFILTQLNLIILFLNVKLGKYLSFKIYFYFQVDIELTPAVVITKYIFLLQVITKYFSSKHKTKNKILLYDF